MPVDQARAPLWRADLFFHGLDIMGATYRAAVFFNRPRARHDTPEDAANGYAGAFFLFGKGGCFGDEGHCDPQPRHDRFDHRLAPQNSPTVRAVDVTDALRREVANGATELVVSVVPELADLAGIKGIDVDTVNPVRFESVQLVTYDAYAPVAERMRDG